MRARRRRAGRETILLFAPTRTSGRSRGFVKIADGDARGETLERLPALARRRRSSIERVREKKSGEISRRGGGGRSDRRCDVKPRGSAFSTPRGFYRSGIDESINAARFSTDIDIASRSRPRGRSSARTTARTSLNRRSRLSFNFNVSACERLMKQSGGYGTAAMKFRFRDKLRFLRDGHRAHLGGVPFSEGR